VTVRVGVIGCGPMGQGHIKHYASLPGCDLVGVLDKLPERRFEASVKTGATAYSELEPMLEKVDAVSIASPTTTHRDLALKCMEAGVHVLVEKPLAQDATEAEEIVAAAEKHGVVLMVGHIERFNPAFAAAKEVVNDPRYVVADRLSPYSFRSQDIGVVLDLMIHDLDIILEFVAQDVTSLEAIGLPVISASEDMCDARLRFAGGALADVRASRVSLKRMRKFRLFQSDGYVSIDYNEKTITTFRKTEEYRKGEIDPSTIDPALLEDPYGFVFGGLLEVKEHSMVEVDALRAELESFLGACRGEHPPLVPGSDGLRAVRLASRIQLDVAHFLSKESERAGIELPEAYRKMASESPREG
jgi:predicted dehydrogenase